MKRNRFYIFLVPITNDVWWFLHTTIPSIYQRQCNSLFITHAWAHSCPVVSISWQPWLQLIRLLRLWDSPGNNTRAGFHSLLQRIFPHPGTTLQVSCFAGRFFTPLEVGVLCIINTLNFSPVPWIHILTVPCLLFLGVWPVFSFLLINRALRLLGIALYII